MCDLLAAVSVVNEIPYTAVSLPRSYTIQGWSAGPVAVHASLKSELSALVKILLGIGLEVLARSGEKRSLTVRCGCMKVAMR